MRIESARLGFANNSSSSHSVIIGCHDASDQYNDLEFGWDDFVLASPQAKRSYMSVNIFCALCSQFGNRISKLIVKDITGFEIPEKTDTDGYERYAYVDHDSVIQVPIKFGPPYAAVEPEFDFLKELTDTVSNNNKYVIVGGNDNRDEPLPHSLVTENNRWTPFHSIPTDNRMGPLVARRNGLYWTLFNRNTGAKIRLTFNDNAPPQTCSETPELVDLCITKHCLKKCGFCYQGASREGQHADIKVIEQIIWKLKNAQVLEVAVGGGEPTSHPDFIKILEMIYDRGIVPNFTTADVSWMEDDNIAKAVRKYCGSFAISITDYNAVERAYRWNCNDHREKSVRASVQVPLGGPAWRDINREVTKALVLYVPITFLGYKECGKASSRKAEPYCKHMIEWMKTHEDTEFGADTVFVKEFESQLRKMNIHPKLISDGEGLFSCYIDAVEQKIGKHSYGSLMKSFDTKSQEFYSNDLFCDFPYR